MRRINDRKQQHLFDPWYFLSPKRRAMLDQQLQRKRELAHIELDMDRIH